MFRSLTKNHEFGVPRNTFKLSSQDWVKKMEKIGFPVQLIFKLIQLVFAVLDLMVISLMMYKEMWLALFLFFIPLPKKTLHNEIAVIIGSSRGLGRELALKLAKLKANVICIDVQSPEQETTTETILTAGGSATYFQCDVSNRERVEDTFATIAKDIGNVTMLYHCNSLPIPDSVNNNPPSVKQTIDVSVTSYFYLLNSILPQMKANGKGHIVFLTSVAAVSGFTQQLAVNVSQFAVQGLFETVVEELRVAKLDKLIKTTLVHIYPFIVSQHIKNALSARLPGFFGSIRDDTAAERIIDGVRKNKAEISIPSYGLMLSNGLKLFPRPILHIFRNFLDAGLEF